MGDWRVFPMTLIGGSGFFVPETNFNDPSLLPNLELIGLNMVDIWSYS
jgi:hypothetical protein